MLDTEKNRRNGPEFFIPTMYSPSRWENTIRFKKRYTYEDYEKLPEGAPYQLIGGELIMTPSPIPYHQEILRELGFRFLSFLAGKKSGHLYYAPLDVSFGETEVYQPDIIFIRKEREEIIGKTKIEGAPDIVLEILSPTTAYYDLRKKFKVYEECGVSEYWIIDPELRKIEVYGNENKKFKICSEAEGVGDVSSVVLEGFKVELDDIFGITGNE